MRNLLKYVVGMLLYASCFAQSTIDALKTEWKLLQQEEAFKKANVSLSVMRCDTKSILVKENAKVLAPASNLKLVTTATAMALLGPDFRYQTTLEHTGKVSNDTLYGDLVIRGAGDPSLGSERLSAPFLSADSLMLRWALATRKAGIRVITGKIVVDMSVMEYNPLPDNWSWGDMGNYYGAGIFGLNINDNLYRVFFNGGAKEGAPASVVKMYPDPGFSSIRNEILSGPVGSGDEAYLYAAPYASGLYMKGTIPMASKSFAVRGSIPDPARTTARWLAAKLKTNSVMLNDTLVRIDYDGIADTRILDTYESPTLAELAKLTNVYSLNLYAECMLRTLGKKFGSAGSTEEGAKVVKGYWQKKGLDINGWQLYDGSGLSFNNAIATSQLCWILASIRQEKWFDQFYKTLPVAGVSGTVYRLGRGSKLAGNGRLKSGSLSKVTCYSGYITSADGVLLSVAVFANHYDTSSSMVVSKLEGILKKVADLRIGE